MIEKYKVTENTTITTITEKIATYEIQIPVQVGKPPVFAL